MWNPKGIAIMLSPIIFSLISLSGFDDLVDNPENYLVQEGKKRGEIHS